jgi:hypothetical protein
MEQQKITFPSARTPEDLFALAEPCSNMRDRILMAQVAVLTGRP